MADVLTVLSLKLPEYGGPNKPFIWFFHQEAPVGSILSSCALELVFALEEYSDWYGDIINFFSYGHLLDNHHKE